MVSHRTGLATSSMGEQKSSEVSASSPPILGTRRDVSPRRTQNELNTHRRNGRGRQEALGEKRKAEGSSRHGSQAPQDGHGGIPQRARQAQGSGEPWHAYVQGVPACRP